MPRSLTKNIALIIAATLLSACSRTASENKSPTGLTPRMNVTEAINIIGPPDTIKKTGSNKEIYIYRRQNEIISVFFVDGQIKNIEHIARRPRIEH